MIEEKLTVSFRFAEKTDARTILYFIRQLAE